MGGDGDPEVFVADEQTDIPVDLERWQELAAEVLRSEGVRGLAELALLFVSETEMSELNELHMGKPGPTDVLAFAMREGEGAEHAHGAHGLLGDVIVSLETAARQGPTHGRSLDAEVTMLLAHGLLHLLGFDHRDRTEERRMTARTDALRAVALGTKRSRT